MASSREKLDGNVIADTSINQPVFITMLVVLVLVIGFLAYSSLPVNFFPDIDLPTVAVVMSYPGAGPESMVDQVTKPVEDQIQTTNGLKHLTSESREGVVTFIAEFDSSSSSDRVLQDVRDKVNAILPALPAGVKQPTFLKFDPNQQPILTVALSSNAARSPLALRSLVDDEIAPRIQQATGVGSVTVSGGQVRQINVQMDLDKLKAWHVLPVQITRAIRDANTNLGLGSITTGQQEINLRTPSMLQTPNDIGKLLITGTPYHVKDLATIEDGSADVQGYARLDGKDAISIDIRRQSGTNVVQVADNVKKQLTAIFADHPDLAYFIPSDQSTSVRDSTDSAIEELIIAAIAAMVVVLVFFRDLRNTLVTVAGLPVIMIGTFAALKFFGISINLISLLALSVSVGLVIDDAIVVRENIFRQMERGLTPRVGSSRGTSQVALSVLAMSLTVIAVFLPVAFTGGITGIIFKSFGLTVASAMAISLVEAFTFAPMLSAIFFKQKHPAAGVAAAPIAEDRDQELLDEAHEDPGWMGRVFGRMLAWSLRHRWVVVLVALGVFVLSGFAAAGLKLNFIPQQDSRQFSIGFQLPAGSALAETDRLARQAEAILLKDPAIEAMQTAVGGAGSSESGSFFIKLKVGQSTLATEDRLRPQLSFLPTLVMAKPSFGGASTAITARDIQLSVETPGDINALVPLLLQLQTQAKGNSALGDIDTTYKPGKPELRVRVDPGRSGDLGFSNDDIASSLRALIGGDTATTFRQNGKDADVVVRLKPGDRASLDKIRSISVPTAGGSIPLTAIATIELASSPTTIRRYDRLNQVLIGANVQGGQNVAEVQAGIAQVVDQLKLPPGVKISFQGQTANQAEGFNTLFIAMGLSLLFVYMVLASQFGSFLQPLVIMLAMPFSFIGAFLALRITGLELSVIGMIGLIMLLGLVVKNSILMVDFTNRLRRAGMEKHQALERAGAIRLRPILMTTLALVVGSVPSAIGLGEGAEIRRSLSVVVIGGLVTSMFLTLMVIPTAYSLLDSITTRVSRLLRWRAPSGWRRRRTEQQVDAADPYVVGQSRGEAINGNGAEPAQAAHNGHAPVDTETGALNVTK